MYLEEGFYIEDSVERAQPGEHPQAPALFPPVAAVVRQRFKPRRPYLDVRAVAIASVEEVSERLVVLLLVPPFFVFHSPCRT